MTKPPLQPRSVDPGAPFSEIVEPAASQALTARAPESAPSTLRSGVVSIAAPQPETEPAAPANTGINWGSMAGALVRLAQEGGGRPQAENPAPLLPHRRHPKRPARLSAAARRRRRARRLAALLDPSRGVASASIAGLGAKSGSRTSPGVTPPAPRRIKEQSGWMLWANRDSVDELVDRERRIWLRAPADALLAFEPAPHGGGHVLTEASRALLAALVQPSPVSGGKARAPSAAPAVAHALLTVVEAADMLRCSQRQVRRLIATGRLRAARATERGSSRVLIERAAVERYVRALLEP